jgi:putative transposase
MVAVQALKHFRESGYYWLYAYCVMPDHMHAAIRSRDHGVHLSRIVAMLKSFVKCAARRIDPSFAWQRGYHERALRSYENSQDVVRYVVRNPVRARLVGSEEQYPFSGVIDPWR